MRTLTKEQIESIKENYTADAAEAMLNPENTDKVLAYVERAARLGVVISYNQAFGQTKALPYMSRIIICVYSLIRHHQVLLPLLPSMLRETGRIG